MTLETVLKNIECTAIKSKRDPKEILLVAVTKGHSLDEIKALHQLGVHDFGENRVQEALPKMEASPKEINWHFIGTLQKNKVQKVIGRFALIHSVDSPELALKIASLSQSSGVITPILLQVNTSGELSKHGLNQEGWRPHLNVLLKEPFLSIQGLMTLAPLGEEEKIIRSTFSALRSFKEEWGLKHLSMGMSSDYEIAIEEGATILRLGRALFS